MGEGEGTPEDFARMAAELRGEEPPQDQKAKANRELLESIHPPDPEPEPDLEARSS
jgi:hypothetical protein